jgi:hypothetical protein
MSILTSKKSETSSLPRSDAVGDLRNIDQKILWFTQRLASLRMERMMCQMTIGGTPIQADPQYLENIYVAHLCKLREERVAQVEVGASDASMDTE